MKLLTSPLHSWTRLRLVQVVITLFVICCSASVNAEYLHCLTLSPTKLSFPAQAINSESAPREVILTNKCNVSQEIYIEPDYIACLEPSPCPPPPPGWYTDFHYTTTCTQQPLPTGASCKLTITFMPSGGGTRVSSLMIGGSDGMIDGTDAHAEQLSLEGFGGVFVTVPTLNHWGLFTLVSMLPFILRLWQRRCSHKITRR